LREGLEAGQHDLVEHDKGRLIAVAWAVSIRRVAPHFGRRTYTPGKDKAAVW